MLDYNFQVFVTWIPNSHGNTSDEQEDTEEYALKFEVRMPNISLKRK
jgi:hypothetical protein